MAIRFLRADSAQAGTTILAMRVLDVVRATDYLAGRADLRDRSIMLVGEGLGGVWALAAAVFDDRPGGVVCVRTVPSYRLVVGSQYYLVRDYFWTPGHFAISTARPGRVGGTATVMLIVRSTQCWNAWTWTAAARCTAGQRLYRALGSPEALQYRQTPDGTVEAARAARSRPLLADWIRVEAGARG